MEIQLIKINNPFNRYDRDIQVIDYQRQNLFELRSMHFPGDIDVIVSLNGKIISEDCLASTYPAAGDQILFIPNIRGGDDDKMILRSVLLIAVAIAAPYAAMAILSVSSMTFGAALLAGGIALAGGYLVNTLLPPPKPKIPTADLNDFDTSIAYSWSPQTTQQQGLVIPKIYGKTKVYGNIISTFIENANQKQYLNVLIDLGLGPIAGLSDFKINDQPKDNYKGVDIFTRYGDMDQEPIHNFNETLIEYPLAVKIIKEDSPYTYTTVGNAFDGLEVDITFPQGLWHLNDRGELDNYRVDVKIEIKKQGTDQWTPITHQVITKKQSDGGYWSVGAWMGDDTGNETWYEYMHDGTDPNAHYEGEWYNKFTGLYYRWIGSPIYLVDVVVDYVTVSGKQTSPIRRTFKADNLTYGIYQIRVSKLTVERTSSKYGDDMFLTAIREVFYDDFQYPRHALVGIKALATDQLSGSLRFSCIAEGAKIRVYNGVSWSVAFSNNPAWVCWDILTQPVFDNDLNVIRYDGIDPSRLDLIKFKEWADFCDELVPDGKGEYEKRITFNGIFDSETTMWEAALQVCQVGRAILVWNGVKLTVAIDKPSSPVQLFTVGNISIDSFRETFLSVEDRASEIEIDFINSEKDYERDKISVINFSMPNRVNKVTLQLFGITKPSEVWRAAAYMLANNQYITRTIEFEADIDAIACTIGDVINIQHDIPQWGYGGRIVFATPTTVILDRKIPIDISKSYSIMIRLSDDTIVERYIVNPQQNGEYDTFTVSSAFLVIPQIYDIYAFGEVNKVVKPFRVLNISRSQEQKMTITAVEYNENIYGIDIKQPVIPYYNYSSLDVLPSVSDIELDELLIKNKDGSIINVIDIYFSTPNNPGFAYAEIWYNTGTGWIYAGSTPAGYFRLQNVEDNKEYQIAAVTVNTLGQKQSIQNAPKASIFTLGKLAAPSDVQNFDAKQNGQFIDFSWSHIPDADLWGYEIRQGINWESARLIASGISQNRYTYRAGLNGTYRYLIKAIDTSGIYSSQATPADITLRGIDENLNIVLTQDEMTKSPPADGVKTNFVYISAYHSLMFPFSLTDTDVPDWTDTTPEITSYAGDVNLYAEYITNPIDTYKDIDTWIRIQEVIDAIDVGTTDQSYPDRTDLTYPNDTDTHITMPVDFAIYYSISDDNVIYTDWKEYIGPVQSNFRYAKIKFTVNIASQTGRLKLQEFRLVFDVPDVNGLIKDLAIAAGTGTDIIFHDYGLVFYTVPIVKAFVKNAAGNRAPSISNLTAEGCHIDVYDSGNIKVAATVDLEITGY